MNTPIRSPLSRAAVIAALAMNGACTSSSSTTAGGAAAPNAVGTPEYFDTKMAWERAPLRQHPLHLADGAISGEIESDAPPRIECSSVDGSGTSCSVMATLGEDEYGDARVVDCTVMDRIVHFGVMVKSLQGDLVLTELPVVEAWQVGDGVAGSFEANVRTEDGGVFGTYKFAMLLSRGNIAACVDRAPGGRETFQRVARGLFDSLRFAETDDPPLFTLGYRMREGDQAVGFRYGRLYEREDGTFVEESESFGLRTTEDTWSVLDYRQTVERNVTGEITLYQSALWSDGNGPHVITARPSEGGRFRIKAEVGERSDSLELTPKAPLGTELWSAVALGRIASGNLGSHVYAEPGLEHGDPSLDYILLDHSAPGVVAERQVAHGDYKSHDANLPSDELHVDDRGVVVKEVSSHSVAELLFASGSLPTAATPRPTRRARR